MKLLAILVATATFFVFGISAFAYSSTGGSSSLSYAPGYQNQSVMFSRRWVGMTTDQLVKQLGKPDSISVSANGHSIYNYDTVQTFGIHERTTQWTFDIAPNGIVASENSSIF